MNTKKEFDYLSGMKTISLVNEVDDICKDNIDSRYKIFIIQRLIEEWRNK